MAKGEGGNIDLIDPWSLKLLKLLKLITPNINTVAATRLKSFSSMRLLR